MLLSFSVKKSTEAEPRPEVHLSFPIESTHRPRSPQGLPRALVCELRPVHRTVSPELRGTRRSTTVWGTDTTKIHRTGQISNGEAL